MSTRRILLLMCTDSTRGLPGRCTDPNNEAGLDLNIRRACELIVLIGLLVAGQAHAGNGGPHHGNEFAGIPIFTGMGDPLPGVAKDRAELMLFSDGLLDFVQVDTIAEGTQLGPLFNNTSCAACHDHPAAGGSGLNLFEQRLSNGGPPVQIFAVDAMLFSGPAMQGSNQIFPTGIVGATLGSQIGTPLEVPSTCQKTQIARGFSPSLPVCIPGSSNDSGLTGAPTCIAHREALPLMGDGLVEATDDSTFQDIAANQPDAIRGVVRMVADIDQTTTGVVSSNTNARVFSAATTASLGIARVGRFGWKDQFATLLGFSGDAYLNEIGISNALNTNPNSTCALGVQQFAVTLQVAGDPEDTPDSSDVADIDRFTNFMRRLQPPPELSANASATRGKHLFEQIGCNGCHVETMTTSSNPAGIVPPSVVGTPITDTLNRILAKVAFHPFGDFLLHDMGPMADGINDDPNIPHDERLMRTMPLWGIRSRQVFLHDGRATDIPTSISLHAGQGAAAAAAFNALSSDQQQSVVDFLNTL